MRFRWWTFPLALLMFFMMAMLYIAPPIIGMPVMIFGILGIALKFTEVKNAR